MSGEPIVSVVAATHNRADRLKRLLDALQAQSIGVERFEVMIVDDGSRDETPRVLADAATRGDMRLTAFRQDPAGGPAKARNRGWRAATAPLVAFTDDDCRPEATWLESLLKAHDGAEGRIVQGQTLPDPTEEHNLGPFAKTLRLTELTAHFETCNILYPRELLQRLDGFDEGYPAPAGEDTDLGRRAVKQGATVIFTPEAVVYHAVFEGGWSDQVRIAKLATDDLRAYKMSPDLRELLPQRIFYRRSHPMMFQALLALAIARKSPAALAFTAPYLLNVAGRVRARQGSAVHIPAYVALDFIELGATLRGAVRHRIPIV
jgi:GT2 family glycosyltransferase